MRLAVLVSLFVISTFGVFLSASMAQNSSLRIIRDTEIEKALEGWMYPLLKAAGMGENSVKLILVQSNDVNAFVAGGANIFIYTGLIEQTSAPEELIGVMAHELGHITGGHLIRGREAMERASYESILGTVLGVGAAVLGGGTEAGVAIARGGQGLATGRYLAHSRVAESSADQAAFRFMDEADIDTRALISFLEKMQGSEISLQQYQNEYTRTHPLTRNRITALATKVQESQNTSIKTPTLWVEQHARIKAKLEAYINPERVEWEYDPTRKTTPAQYARAIASYRKNNTDKALDEADILLSKEPQNPYFLELKAQMLRDFGRIQESIPLYERALEIIPQASLIQIDYAQALLADKQYDKAITALKNALKYERRSARAHRLLATAYGHQGRDGIAKLHLAEEAVLKRNFSLAKQHTQGALITFEEGDENWQRAQDILRHIENSKLRSNKKS